MSKFVSIYIFERENPSFKRFDNIEISQASLNRAINNPELEAISISSLASPYNRVIFDELNIRLIWVSPNEGEVIAYNRSTLWLSIPNDILAIQKFIEYEAGFVKQIAESYETNLKNSSKRIMYLHSKIENPDPKIYKVPVES